MARGNEENVVRNMRALAESTGEDALLSAGSMWWRLQLRMRQEHARRAQAPLIWMARIFYVVVAILVAFLLVVMADEAKPALTIGILSLVGLAIPVSLTLWAWYRSSLYSKRREPFASFIKQKSPLD